MRVPGPDAVWRLAVLLELSQNPLWKFDPFKLSLMGSVWVIDISLEKVPLHVGF